MKITLLKEEMRRRLRLLAGLEPVRADCTIEYTDGLDIDGLLDCKLRAWYLDLLDNGDMSLLAPTDIAATSRSTDGPYEASAISLPAMCRRVDAIRLEGWSRSVKILGKDMVAATVRRQSNPFLAATPDSPIAVENPGGTGGSPGDILAWPKGKSVSLLTAVLDAGPDSYTLDETALGQLDALAKQLNIF